MPSAFTLQTGKDHWHVLLRARAIENQVFVMAPAQFGAHGPNRASYGHALVVDPWGAVIAECGDHEGFALARLNFAYQDQVRAALPCLSHGRPASLSSLLGPGTAGTADAAAPMRPVTTSSDITSEMWTLSPISILAPTKASTSASAGFR